MSEHSKGPWTYDERTGKIRDANGVGIADDMAFGGPIETPTTANMLLMAAAPELVEELWRLVSLARLARMALPTTEKGLAMDLAWAVQEARAALKKAGVES